MAAVSDDGSRVYFVAQGVLANNVGVSDHGPRPRAHTICICGSATPLTRPDTPDSSPAWTPMT